MKTLLSMGPFLWIFAAMVVAVAALGGWVALLRARGGWTPLETRLGVTLIVLTACFPAVGLVGTVVMLARAFASVGHAAASEKATLLSQQIAGAMSCTALGLGLVIPSGLVAALALASGARRKPRAQG